MATTGISLIREQTETMRLPRFLAVPFELGRPFGAPNEPDFQRRVLRDSLELLDRIDGPGILDDFPDDAPFSDQEAVWACPVVFESAPSDEPEFAREVAAEMALLAPWLEGGAAIPKRNSGMAFEEMTAYLAFVAEGGDPADFEPATQGPVEASLVETTRLVCDDLRSLYTLAASRQPGNASTDELNTWFWRQTAVGRLIGKVAQRLGAEPDRAVRAFAQRGLVPRKHLDYFG